MRPIVLHGHTRPLTQLKYNKEGDLIFSVGKDKLANVWYSHNGERLGTLDGHNGAVFSVDVDNTTTLALTGAADGKVRLWHTEKGKMLFEWYTKATARRVEFSPCQKKFLVVTEEHMGLRGSVRIFPIEIDLNATPSSEPLLEIQNPEDGSNVTGACWTYDGCIITGHSNGEVSKYDVNTGEKVLSIKPHEDAVTDIQTSPDKTYVISSSRDKTAKLLACDDLREMHTYQTETPLNSATITPLKDFVVLGGGQDAGSVTTTAAREGKFESRFHHKIFEDEIGRMKGHFGPINTVVAHPDGRSFASGGEDGYIRIHHFDKSYFDFYYDVERPVALV